METVTNNQTSKYMNKGAFGSSDHNYHHHNNNNDNNKRKKKNTNNIIRLTRIIT